MKILFRVADPRAPSYLSSRFLGEAITGYIYIYTEPSSHYSDNWEP